MKPITKEQLEQADDFVFHLTEQQLKDWLADYRKRQYNLGTQIILEMNSYKKKEQQDNYLRMFVTISKCFDAYEGGIPLITKAEVERGLKGWSKRLDKIDEKVPIYDCLLIIAQGESQQALANYILYKFVEYPYLQDIFDFEERARLAWTILCYSFVINDKIKKFLPKPDMFLDSKGNPCESAEFREEKEVMYFELAEFTKIILETREGIVKLDEDFATLSESYQIYFDGVMKISRSLDSYLYTMKELEKKMPINNDAIQIKHLWDIVHLIGKVTTDGTKSMKDTEIAKEAIYNLGTKYSDCIAFVDKTIPDSKKCLAEVKRFESVCNDARDKYKTMKRDLPGLMEELEHATKLLNTIMN